MAKFHNDRGATNLLEAIFMKARSDDFRNIKYRIFAEFMGLGYERRFIQDEIEKISKDLNKSLSKEIFMQAMEYPNTEFQDAEKVRARFVRLYFFTIKLAIGDYLVDVEG